VCVQFQLEMFKVVDAKKHVWVRLRVKESSHWLLLKAEIGRKAL
jgi:hypothetical protein